MKSKNILLGAHISVAGGFSKAVKRAEEIGANCFQIFTKSNRQWHAKEISPEEESAFIDALKSSSISEVIAHGAYLINVGSANNETVKKSTESLAQELQRCEQLHIPYLVLHPGTARFDDETQSLEFIAENIDKAFDLSKTNHVLLLLETMAGQGNTLGYTFKQLATIINRSRHANRIGICFDTCHAFAAGYDFSTPTSYRAMWQEFDQELGIKKLKVFHINDSKKEFGSKVDRHEGIGMGKIPIEAFALLLQDKKFEHVPKIIETPEGSDKTKSDKQNINILKSLVD